MASLHSVGTHVPWHGEKNLTDQNVSVCVRAHAHIHIHGAENKSHLFPLKRRLFQKKGNCITNSKKAGTLKKPMPCLSVCPYAHIVGSFKGRL